jgi:hypothetical protein
MTAAMIFVLKDWITWPVIVLVCIVVAILAKDDVRAAVRIKRFQFSLEAKNIKLKEKQ